MIPPEKQRVFEFKANFPSPWKVCVGQSPCIPDERGTLLGFPEVGDGILPFEDAAMRAEVSRLVETAPSMLYSVRLEGDGLLTLLLCLQENLEVVRVAGVPGARVTVNLEDFQYFFGLEARKLKRKVGEDEYLQILGAIHRHLGLSKEDWRDL